MSQYASPAQFRALALRPEAVAAYQDSDIVVFLVQASAIIDSYIASRYLQYGPLITWGNELVGVCCYIAAYLLLSQRGLDPANPSDAMLIDRYKDSMKLVRDVQNSRASLNVQTTQPAASNMPRVYSRPQRGW